MTMGKKRTLSKQFHDYNHAHLYFLMILINFFNKMSFYVKLNQVQIKKDLFPSNLISMSNRQRSPTHLAHLRKNYLSFSKNFIPLFQILHPDLHLIHLRNLLHGGIVRLASIHTLLPLHSSSHRSPNPMTGHLDQVIQQRSRSFLPHWSFLLAQNDRGLAEFWMPREFGPEEFRK